MPPKATQKDADGVAFMLAALGFSHIRARAVRDHVLLETGSLDDPIARIRLRKISAEDWRVEMKVRFSLGKNSQRRSTWQRGRRALRRPSAEADDHEVGGGTFGATY